jgi:hypothetical protein
MDDCTGPQVKRLMEVDRVEILRGATRREVPTQVNAHRLINEISLPSILWAHVDLSKVW